MDGTFKEDIALKKSRIRTLEKDLNNRKEKLRETLGIIDYTHVICLNLTFLMACLHNTQEILNTQEVTHRKRIGESNSFMTHSCNS